MGKRVKNIEDIKKTIDKIQDCEEFLSDIDKKYFTPYITIACLQMNANFIRKELKELFKRKLIELNNTIN